MGDLKIAKKLIDTGKNIGLDAVKFQLFRNRMNGNIPIEKDQFKKAFEYGQKIGIPVFASVWESWAYDFLRDCGADRVKFAYSMREKVNDFPLDDFKKVYVSLGVIDQIPDVPRETELIKYYCLPYYPVPFTPDFTNIFPRFDGFSSHCMGIEHEASAVKYGAKYLEFHYTLDDDLINCPDHRFAKKPKEARQLVRKIHGLARKS